MSAAACAAVDHGACDEDGLTNFAQAWHLPIVLVLIDLHASDLFGLTFTIGNVQTGLGRSEQDPIRCNSVTFKSIQVDLVKLHWPEISIR